MNINGQDAFFLTFFAAWISVRIGNWGEHNIVALIILICAIFFFVLIIGWLRICLAEKKIVHTFLFYFSVVLLTFCVVFLAGFHKNYLKLVDIQLMIALGLIWAFIAFVERWEYDINLTPKKHQLNHEQQNNTVDKG